MSDLLEPLQCSPDEVASVPRRFGVGVMMILMTAFAVIFAILKTFGAAPELFAVIAVLFFAVTVAQIVLFKGERPRAASVWTGGVAFPLSIQAVVLCHVAKDRLDLAHIIASHAIFSVLFGAILGYLAGGVMAGIFFLQERWNRRKIPLPEVQLVPLTEADFSTLCQWVENRQLFDLWSHGRFRYPLDAEQLRVWLGGETPPDQPKHVVYKALYGDEQDMAAMVELANIDRQQAFADIELAIVDPARSDRPLISGCLLRAAVREAFDRQGLRWLRAIIDRRATLSWHASASAASTKSSSVRPRRQKKPPSTLCWFVAGRAATSRLPV